MRIVFEPGLPKGRICAPPSKSELHRLLICAGLAGGESQIENVSAAEDIRATLRCLRAFGASVRSVDGKARVVGFTDCEHAGAGPYDCGECGSTLRFFLPLCAVSEHETLLTGSVRLLQRPLGVYERLFAAQGIPFLRTGREIRVGGALSPGRFVFPGDVSSQFVTGLLFALPLLRGDSEIRLTGRVESRPYIDMTLDALRLCSVQIERKDERTLLIPGGRRFTPFSAAAGGDWSNAAFWFAMRALGAELSVEGPDERSLQGDRVCETLIGALAEGRQQIDLSDCPDLGPVLMAVAAACRGAVFTGTRRLRLKESDRGAAMAEELAKLGACAEVEDNRITVRPAALKKPSESLFGHGDHRIVMALSCLLVKTGGALVGAEAAAKSYPDFFDILLSLGARISILQDAPGGENVGGTNEAG